MSEADTIFSDVLEFSAHLRSLRENRLANKTTGENHKKKTNKKTAN